MRGRLALGIVGVLARSRERARRMLQLVVIANKTWCAELEVCAKLMWFASRVLCEVVKKSSCTGARSRQGI